MSSTPKTKSKSDFTGAETARRRDAAIKVALETPPKPMSAYIGKGKPKPPKKAPKR